MSDLATKARLWGIEPGYHDVFGKWHDVAEATQRRLIAAISLGHDCPPPLPTVGEPVCAFQGDGRRYWLLTLQLYAVRSARNWGFGDFGDLAELIPIVASAGGAGIGLNPLHALFIDRAAEASPYAPNSRIFLNPLYIDLDAVPDFPGATAAGIDLEVLRAGDLIDHVQVARAKLDGLRLAFENFRAAPDAKRLSDFESYRSEQGERLRQFASFEVLRARFAPGPWQDWPKPWRRPTTEDLSRLRMEQESQCEFHEYMQWIADRQLERCKKIARHCGMPVGLYLDVAVGIHPDGADAWSAQESILSDVTIGAPPDEFNPTGQNWGLAPFNPVTLREQDFAQLRILLKSITRHAGAIRLDHVLGLKRMFLIPRGCSAVDGAYVNFPFELSLHAIAQESLQTRCVVIGEDLGTVPEGFRETMTRWGLWMYRVVIFERDADGRFRPPEVYPAEALATFNTHDLPSLRGWLDGHDLLTKRTRGVDPGESDEARAWAHQCLRAILNERASLSRQDELISIAEFLAQTPSRLVAIALDDVMGTREQVNVPGTVDEYPNWRRRLPLPIEDLEGHDHFKNVAEVFARSGRSWR